jgi:hypothetical protein
VNFGGGLVTAPTPVQVELLAFPTSLQSLQTNGLTFQSFFASDGAAGVLGVGPNAGGPGHVVPTSALPAPFNQGLLINEPAGQLVFQPQPPTVGGLTQLATLSGSPITTLGVQVNGGAIQPVSSIVDSGGVDGTLPTSLNAPTGAMIEVFAPGVTTPLYMFTNGVNYSPTSITSGLMNTGNLIFSQHPVYISYAGNGTTTIYG